MYLSVIFANLRKNIYLCSWLINLTFMAKKKPDNKRTSLDDLAMQEFFKKVEEVQRESRASDIGVVDDMYRYTGEEETQQANNEEVSQQSAAPAPEGEATGDGKPAGEPVPEPPQGGPGGGDSGGRQAGRKRSVRPPKASASEETMQRINLIGPDVPRLKMILYLVKLSNRKGSNARIILDYMEQVLRKENPELVRMVDALMGSRAEEKK